MALKKHKPAVTEMEITVGVGKQADVQFDVAFYPADWRDKINYGIRGVVRTFLGVTQNGGPYIISVSYVDNKVSSVGTTHFFTSFESYRDGIAALVKHAEAQKIRISGNVLAFLENHSTAAP